MECFVDADWNNNLKDIKSCTGKQWTKNIAPSSTETEYIWVISEVTEKAIYLKNLLPEFIGLNKCVVLFNDNQILLIYQKTSKHIDLRPFY